MTLPATGAISAAAIEVEDQRPVMSMVDFNQVSLRKMVNIRADKSQISFNDFHGKAFGVGNGYLVNAFTNVIDLNPATLTTSNTISINDVGVTPVSFALVSDDPTATVSLNGGAGVGVNVPLNMKDGDTLAIKATSATYNRVIISSITCSAGAPKSFSMTTRPYAYVAATAFTAVTNVNPGSSNTSNQITVTGVGTALVQVASQNATAVINGVSIALAGGTAYVRDGDIAQVIQTASYSTSTSVGATVGSSTYNVSTCGLNRVYVGVNHRLFSSAAGPLYYQGTVQVYESTAATASATAIPATVSSDKIIVNGGTATVGGPTIVTYYYFDRWSTEAYTFPSMYDQTDASGTMSGTSTACTYKNQGITYTSAVCEGISGSAYLT